MNSGVAPAPWQTRASFTTQAHPALKQHRGEFESLMIQLGRRQMAVGLVNVRTGGWVEAFESGAMPVSEVPDHRHRYGVT